MYPVWLWCAQWAREKSQQGTTSPLAPGPLHFINLSTGKELPLGCKSFTHTIVITQREEANKPMYTETEEYGGLFRMFSQTLRIHLVLYFLTLTQVDFCHSEQHLSRRYFASIYRCNLISYPANLLICKWFIYYHFRCLWFYFFIIMFFLISLENWYKLLSFTK